MMDARAWLNKQIERCQRAEVDRLEAEAYALLNAGYRPEQLTRYVEDTWVGHYEWIGPLEGEMPFTEAP